MSYSTLEYSVSVDLKVHFCTVLVCVHMCPSGADNIDVRDRSDVGHAVHWEPF